MNPDLVLGLDMVPDQAHRHDRDAVLELDMYPDLVLGLDKDPDPAHLNNSEFIELDMCPELGLVLDLDGSGSGSPSSGYNS